MRDRLLATAIWMFLFVFLSAYWASHLATPGVVRRIPLPGAWPEVMVLALVLVVPSSAIVLGFPRSPSWFAAALRGWFHRPTAFSFMMVGYWVLQVLIPSRSETADPLITVGLVSVVCLMIMWLLWGRESIDLQACVLAAAWVVGLLSTRRTILFVLANVDLSRASNATQLFFLGELALGASLMLMPIAGFFVVGRRFLHAAVAYVRRLPWWPFVLFMVIESVALAILQWTDWEQARIVIMANAIGQLAGPILALAIIRILGAADTREQDASPRWARPMFMAGLVTIGLFYCYAAARFAASQLDYYNPDGLAYLTIARAYAEGEPAIRGYWSPLISWLAAAGARLGLDPRVAFKAASGAGGLALILTSNLLARSLGLRPVTRLVISAAVGAIALQYALNLAYSGAADVLGAACIAAYLAAASRFRDSSRPVFFGLTAGVCGGLAYFGKYYNLPFVLTHLLFTLVLLLLERGDRARRLLAPAVALLVIAAMVLPWSIALSRRYGRPTVTTAGAVNFALRGQTYHPIWSGELCQLPGDVLFPFEDPQGSCYDDYGWSPLSDPADLRFEIELIGSNLVHWPRLIASAWGPLPLLALVASLGALVLAWDDPARRHYWAWITGTAILYSSGYMFMQAGEPRLYLATFPVLLLMLYRHVEAFVRRIPRARPVPAAVSRVMLQVGLFLVPIMTFGRLSSLQYLAEFRSEPCAREMAPALTSLLEAPMAGTDPMVNYIAFHTRTQTFGAIPADTSPEEASRILRTHGIVTFLSPAGGALAEALTADFGFWQIGEARICGAEYSVLRVQ